jgi:type III secretory pathway component EscV
MTKGRKQSKSAEMSIPTGTGTVVDEQRTPVKGTDTLAGSKAAKKAAISAAASEIRSKIIALSSSSDKASAKAWADGLIALFKSGTEEDVKAALKSDRVKGSKATTVDTQLAQARTMYSAYKAVPLGPILSKTSKVEMVRSARAAITAQEAQAARDQLAREARLQAFEEAEAKGKGVSKEALDAAAAKAIAAAVAKQVAETEAAEAKRAKPQAIVERHCKAILSKYGYKVLLACSDLFAKEAKRQAQEAVPADPKAH